MEPATLTDNKPRRQLEPALEAYPEIDFERVSEIAASLADAESDAEAISRVLESPGFIVHQQG